MCVEGPHDLEGAGEDPDLAIIASNKQVVGSRAYAAEISTLASLVGSPLGEDIEANTK